MAFSPNYTYRRELVNYFSPTSGLGHARVMILHHRQCWPCPASSRNTLGMRPKLCVHKPPPQHGEGFLLLPDLQSNTFHSHREANCILALENFRLGSMEHTGGISGFLRSSRYGPLETDIVPDARLLWPASPPSAFWSKAPGDN